MRPSPAAGALSRPIEARILIVNADDFGHGPGVNAGIIRAHEQGIVTSASLMVRWPAAHDAARYVREGSRLSVGLHVDLGEWVPADGGWETAYEVVELADEARVEAEVRAQLDAFRELVGMEPTHVDSHQHVHMKSAQAAKAVHAVAAELGLPLRHRTPAVRFNGGLYGQTSGGGSRPEGITLENLLRILHDLEPGVTELGCHPGEGRDIDSQYRDERETELALLCDPRVREAIEREGILLRSFADLRVGA